MANIFLDTSALAKFYHHESGSDYVEHLLDRQNGNRVFISPLSLVEMESVLANKAHTGRLSPAGVDVARRKLRVDLAKRGSLYLRNSRGVTLSMLELVSRFTALGKGCARWMLYSSRWQCIFQTQGCSTS